MLFWNCQIYFLVFFNFLAWRNSFKGALPPTVGQSFLLTAPSLPNIDGPNSTAILANCWVSNNKGDLPNPSSCPASAILLIISSACGGASLAGVGGCTSGEGLFSLVSTFIAALICSIFISPPLFP